MKTVLFATCAAALLVFGTGQTVRAAEHEKGGGKANASYTGCLAQGDEANEFKLTHVDSGAGEYELVGGKDLKAHVGHKVEVTGELMSPADAEKAEHGETDKKGSEAGHQHLKVASMKHIAASCP